MAVLFFVCLFVILFCFVYFCAYFHLRFPRSTDPSSSGLFQRHRGNRIWQLYCPNANVLTSNGMVKISRHLATPKHDKINEAIFTFTLQISLHREVNNNNRDSVDFWKRLFIKLPNGIHRVNITGHRDTNTTSTGGLLIDDMSIQPCNYYCKTKLYECSSMKIILTLHNLTHWGRDKMATALQMTLFFM